MGSKGAQDTLSDKATKNEKNLDSGVTKMFKASLRVRQKAKLNLPDLELAFGPRCSPVHLLETPLASLLSMHRELWRSGI
jgi:hypothetical protein